MLMILSAIARTSGISPPKFHYRSTTSFGLPLWQLKILSSNLLIYRIYHCHQFVTMNFEGLHCFTYFIFSTKCNISHLCYDVSVHLSVTFVHCGHRVQSIPDIFACLDRWMSLLLTEYWFHASPRLLDGMMPGFLVEEGRGMEKLVLILLTESLDLDNYFRLSVHMSSQLSPASNTWLFWARSSTCLWWCRSEWNFISHFQFHG